MNTYTVSIGRNVADIPMGDDMWADFIKNVCDTLHPYRVDNGSWVEFHTGHGEYGDTREDSAMVTLLSDRILADWELISLRATLMVVARHYGQECVALTIGTSELIFT